jgi:hypothetical protein
MNAGINLAGPRSGKLPYKSLMVFGGQEVKPTDELLERTSKVVLEHMRLIFAFLASRDETTFSQAVEVRKIHELCSFRRRRSTRLISIHNIDLSNLPLIAE